MSIDPEVTAAQTASKLGITFPLLSDTPASVIRQYQMYNSRMQMAHMGYVLIDASGHVRDRANEPKFGAQSPAILQKFAGMKTEK